MLSFTLFLTCLYGVYYIKNNDPDTYEFLKVNSIIALLKLQMMFEFIFNKFKILYNYCDKYIKINYIYNSDIFSNKQILKCDIITYNLNDYEFPTKNVYNINSDTLSLNTSIYKGSICIVEITYDDLSVVRIVNHKDPTIGNNNCNVSFKEILNEIVEKKYSNGLPDKIEMPFLNITVNYNDKEYDIYNAIEKYLLKGNIIFDSAFVRMIMYDYYSVYIIPNTSFTLTIVDKNINFNTIEFVNGINNDSYFCEL